MARNDDLFKTLRQRGVRKNVASAVADGGKKAQDAAREALADLEKAGAAIRTTVLKDDSRTAAAKKAAATRKRNAGQRSAAAERGARTRKARGK